jgi:ElaB/YqjD/DUF883 family membrane-anchored ribosome-binding protein
VANPKTAEDLTDELSRDIKALREDVGDLLATAKDAGLAGARSVAELAGEAAADVGDTVKRSAARARRQGEAAANEIHEMIVDRPVVSVLLAAAAGFLAAKLLR